MTQQPASPSLVQQRAKRLLALRGMIGLSRDALHKRYGIAKATLQNWESARAGGLSPKGARMMVKLYRAEKIALSYDWLMHGVGSGPAFCAQEQQPVPSIISTTASQTKNLADEILHLRQLYDNVVDMPISDHAMSPQYPKDMHVAGFFVDHSAIAGLCGHDCIIQTHDYPLLCRRLLPGDDAGRYHLVALNLTVDYPVLTNMEVIAAAKIVWCRANEFLHPDWQPDA